MGPVVGWHPEHGSTSERDQLLTSTRVWLLGVTTTSVAGCRGTGGGVADLEVIGWNPLLGMNRARFPVRGSGGQMARHGSGLGYGAGPQGFPGVASPAAVSHPRGSCHRVGEATGRPGFICPDRTCWAGNANYRHSKQREPMRPTSGGLSQPRSSDGVVVALSSLSWANSRARSSGFQLNRWQLLSVNLWCSIGCQWSAAARRSRSSSTSACSFIDPYRRVAGRAERVGVRRE